MIEVTGLELVQKSLPRVCVLTGVPSETWRRFRFATLPLGAWMSMGPLSFSSEHSVSGYLPLTRASHLKLAVLTWLPAAIIVLGAILAGLGAVYGLPSSDPTVSNVAAVLLFLGLVAVSSGGIALLVLKRLVGPQGKVMSDGGGSDRSETIVELSRVHPAFVAAVHLTRGAAQDQGKRSS